MRLVRRITQWKEDARLGDWLHPSYGPFPDLALIFDDEEGSYLTATWQTLREKAGGLGRWISLVEGPEHLHAVVQSYSWKVVEKLPLELETRIRKNCALYMRADPADILFSIAKASISAFKTF
jgi:hypothetical protein